MTGRRGMIGLGVDRGENDVTLYRGFDITPAPGGFKISSMGSYPVVTEVFPTKEAAMDCVDAMRKADAKRNAAALLAD